ncbi:MAG: hypothetical protein ACRDON_11210 [Gaiellaceae bacterium]
MLRGMVSRFLVAAVFLVVLTTACGGDGEGETAAEPQATVEMGAEPPAAFDPADFSPEVDHPLVPLTSVRLTVFEGSERDPETGETIEIRIESRVLEKTDRVAGVEVAVVEVKDYEDDELVERTLDYYAQHADGSVWYLGERVDDYEEGEIVGHEGQWLAGEGDAKPGLFMPAEPEVGDAFEQERAPGIAEDRSTVLEVGLQVTAPAGEFSDCVKTEDFAPLDNLTEFKYYCHGVGLVREEPEGGIIELVRYR